MQKFTEDLHRFMISDQIWIWQVFFNKVLSHYNSLTKLKHGTF